MNPIKKSIIQEILLVLVLVLVLDLAACAQSLWGGSAAAVSPSTQGNMAISNTPAAPLQSVPIQSHSASIALNGLTNAASCSNIVFTVTTTQQYIYWPSNNQITNGALTANFVMPGTNVTTTITAAVAATNNLNYTIIGQ